MRPVLLIAAAATATVAAVAPPAPARADSYVTCASQDYRRSWCPVYSPGRVWLDRQYSSGRGACIEGSTWGRDRRGIWVDGGCRARFRVEDRYGYYPDNSYPDYGSSKKDDTGALIGGLILGGLVVGAIAAANSDKDKPSSGSSSSSSSSGVAVEACRLEAVNRVSAYGQRPRIDRITTTTASSGGWTVQGYVSVDAGPKAVSYAFTCRYDNGAATITKLN
ncbi:MAG: DUF3011 domain-containing protein [Phenylobacterium sp.]|uniref:DUF3011 domain-containing protein n=1 Tax=Phenylobacterium sp. TaxID=1871053 RepID=UPI0025CD0EDF|nr:DUF3011 domain-containing protein [Phenylobacterium sp.]MCA3713166.1 DUF3011 domain-containing protein [Phenylobacterium sp.]MCA3724193.1 DUF3011 domain-containing protein [Phenylobacterium sp.]MCA6239405.1 DUF3011 domain-containing protein [Phenylobacterium sp.]MCA6260127.1 DUF3011 domain-containing protein [Phenylobacterium sp.]